MFRAVRLSLLSLVAAGALAGAARAAPRVSGGPVVGLHVTSLHGDAQLDLAGETLAPDLVARERAAAGGFVTVHATGHVAVRAELVYVQRGGKADAADPRDPTSFYELRYASSYLAVPLLATYDITYDGEFTPRVFTGPELSLRLTSTLTGRAGAAPPGAPPVEVSVDEDMTDRSRRVDVQWVLGAGIGLPTRYGTLVIDVRFLEGLTAAVAAHEITWAPGVVLRAGPLRNRAFAVVASFEL